MKNNRPILGLFLSILTFYIVLIGIELLFKHLNWFDMGQRSVNSILYEGIFASLMFLAIMFFLHMRRMKKKTKKI